MLAEIYERAQMQQQLFVNASTILAAVATANVLLRMLARWIARSSFGADDLWISVSLLPLWSLVIAGAVMAFKGGMGLPPGYLIAPQSHIFYRALFASLILYALSITTVKISILLLYRRIFNVQSFRSAIYIVGCACLTWFLVVVLVSIFQCQPVAAAWDKSIQGHCVNLKVLYYAFTISNMILDVVINLMPVRMIWKLQLPLKQRIILLCIMLVGIIVVIASVGRISSVPDLVENEVSATITIPFLYTIIEPAFAIICACLSTYRPLFAWISDLIPYQRLSANINTWLSSSRTSEPSGGAAPRFANAKNLLTSDEIEASNPRSTNEKWPSDLEFRFPDQPPPVPPKDDLSTMPTVPPRNRRAYDETWADGILTRAYDSGLFFRYSNASQMFEFWGRSTEDDIILV